MYFCNVHKLPILQVDQAARYAGCDESYEIYKGVWLLDKVNRQDREAFDEQVQDKPAAFDPMKGMKHLHAAGIRRMDHAVILDAGCGLGDLTLGLAQSDQIAESDVYAFDHSLESLQRAAAAGRPRNGNRIHFSTQDASELCFAESSLDLVVGSAFLHHVLDYGGFLSQIQTLLKPGGKAVFSEPFYDSFLWLCVLLKNAIDDLGVKLNSPELGMADFIINFISSMSRHVDDFAYLDTLTDKHFFREATVTVKAAEAGFSSVTFSTVEGPDFYRNWMEHFLDVYHVRHAGVRRLAIRHYSHFR